MAGKSDFLESLYLKLIFNGTTDATLASAAGTATNLYVALHTADPTDAGTQSSNEVAYTSYARVAVARTTGGWTVSGTNPTQVVPVAPIVFPACTGGSATATYFSIGSASSGATSFYYAGALTPNIVISSGVTPQLAVSTSITED